MQKVYQKTPESYRCSKLHSVAASPKDRSRQLTSPYDRPAKTGTMSTRPGDDPCRWPVLRENS